MALHLEPVNPHSFCEEMAQIFAVQTSEKGIALNIELSPGLPGGLMLDEVRVRQILLNLIGNAVKFTDEGSVTLRVMTENLETDKNTLDLIIEIEDTGIGISEDQERDDLRGFPAAGGAEHPQIRRYRSWAHHYQKACEDDGGQHLSSK